MVWHFIGVSILNRTLHGRLVIRNFSSVLKKYFTRLLRSLVKYFSTLEEKFRISARPCNILYIWLLHVAATGQKVWPCTEILDHLPVFWLPLFLRFIKFSVQGQMGKVKNSKFFAFSLVSKCSYSRTALPIRTLRAP